MSTQNGKTIAAIAADDEERLLLVRAEELSRRAEDGIVSVSDFLNLGEQYLCRRFLTACGKTEGQDYVFYGGYAYAERRMLFCLPEYLSASFPSGQTENGALSGVLSEVCEGEEAVSAVSVSGSGYKTLGHRDYLGALLSLGVERRVLGDIAVTDDAHAVILCKAAMTEFLCTGLERIGADKVRAALYPAEERLSLPDTRKYADISDTVASLRLDGIVASFAGISRDKAKQAVTSGMVELDFRTVTSPDTEVTPGAYLSVRGVGRFLFTGTDGSSKKGRLRIRAKRFI